MSKQNLSSDGQTKKQNFLSSLLSYAREGKRKLVLSVVLSVISITAGLVPYYCFYRILVLFLAGEASVSGIWKWSLLALAAYVVKVLCFGLSTMASHYADYFTPRDPERNSVPLHWFSFANHRFAFGIHPYVLLFNLAQYSRMFILPVSIQ